MHIDDFKRRLHHVHTLTVDFIEVVPDDYQGPYTRDALLRALDQKQSELLAMLDTVDTNAPIDFFGNPFGFGDFAFTVIQHEAIHHGQWSAYASLGGFQTPVSWRNEWGL
jgi:hypothetical protein